MLEVTGLEVRYGVLHAVRGIDLRLADGQVAVVLGSNGAGKTSTLNAICGAVHPVAGRVVFDGTEITGKPSHRAAALGLVQVPEGRHIIGPLTVEENLKLGAYRRSDRGVDDDMTRVFGYFPVLRERLHQQAGTLSGGEQQMLAISRALMLKPRLLLLDEPSFGLAPLLVQEIFRNLKIINKEERVSMLLVEQNARLALELVGKVFLLETGSVVASGPPQQIAADESVRRAYLGQ
jgi:branched-chain amino acid transport system ATP-binding protein